MLIPVFYAGLDSSDKLLQYPQSVALRGRMCHAAVAKEPGVELLLDTLFPEQPACGILHHALQLQALPAESLDLRVAFANVVRIHLVMQCTSFLRERTTVTAPRLIHSSRSTGRDECFIDSPIEKRQTVHLRHFWRVAMRSKCYHLLWHV